MSESNSTIGDELLDEARATIERWAVDINDAGPDFQTLHMFASYLLAIADRALQQRDQLLAALKAIVSASDSLAVKMYAHASDEIERLRSLIREHNAECEELCAERSECDAYRGRGLSCPDCPKDWMIGEAEDQR